jgi:tRNA threonylcarbamoyladenosine biosynthesis protein TsaE
VTAALELATAGPCETRALAGAAAGLVVPGDILLLVGDLGAGKTVFAQGFGAGLGVTEPVTSPTFTLVRQYELPRVPPGGYGAHPVRRLIHADLYRLDHLREVVDLGLEELVEDGGVALVEWGDAALPLLGRGALRVDLEPSGDDEHRRLITLAATYDAWVSRWAAARTALAAWIVPG